MHAKYGPVVRLWLSPVRLLISVEDPQQVRNVLMHARERSPLYCHVIEACLGKDSACFSTFIQPRARRSFLDYHCHTTLKFQVHEVACRVADVTAREWGTLSASGGELDVTQACKDMVVGVLGGSLFGPAFPDSDLRDRVASDLEFFAHSVQDFASFSFLPVWLPAYQKLMRVAEDYRGVIHQLVSGTFAKDVKQQRRGHGEEGSEEGGAGESGSGSGEGEAKEPGPQFLMFGAGARSCVGQRLSLKIIRAAVAILLHRFEFSMSPDMPKEFDTRLEYMVLHLHPTPRLKLAVRS
ncbi:unnamed protein product [Closterium sp. Yama58-4]|nr:unnamed protein product [Closterium sp. Yama58-4]